MAQNLRRLRIIARCQATFMKMSYERTANAEFMAEV